MALNPQAEVTNVLHSLLAQPPKQGPSDARNRPGGRTPVPARTVVPSGEPKNQPPFTRPAKPATGSVAAVTKALKTAPKPAPKKLSPAQRAVHDSLAPLYAQQAQEAAAQNDAIRNFSLAAMQQLSGLAPQIQHDYETQLAQQQGLMGGALASIQGANPNQQTQDLLKAIGAPQSQQDAVAQGNSNAFNLAGAVGNYVDSLPLGSLRAQGLASTTLARLQPSIQALRAQQALAGALLSQKDAKAKIDAMAPDLLAKYQAAEATAANNRATQAARQQQLALEYKALGLKSQNQAFSQGATTARLNQSAARIRNQQNQWLVSQKTKIDEFNAKQATANNKLALPNNSLSRTKGYLVDSRGNAILVNGKRQILPGFKSNAQGRVVKVPTAKSVAALYPDLSKAEVVRLRQGMSALRFGVKPKEPSIRAYMKKQGVDRATAVQELTHPPLTYQQAISEAVSEGYSRASATAMANHFYAPGVQGRPVVGRPTPDRGFRDAKLK